ncbi:tRNA delta(2)-isopentenylpyrophosphate transferase [Legionella beliardensis]|uniref:tRNA dimethylallyltransferase n=1 Tax=Legionella beliardensis TaxID=91822 RepID=A0A378I5A3_9GAMM|nr:tRNA (adenosine(37)-N6)-dimethylallyltransferase MiaA [Legionella beliardensis]STX29851.1 tRNA delta(2)-isopentenylpyrophosphate transferase [Legionella beliardensis]
MVANIFCLLGPTAAGKTALALELVKRFPFEIISVDSAMIYREMNIGTAKPTQAELDISPHHLIDILDPPEAFSAADFCKEASRLSDQIINAGKIPLLVGGTMMYFHALQQGLSALPEASLDLRKSLLEEASRVGWEEMHKQLSHIDPQSAHRIHQNDTQRIQRALEVFHLTGKPLSSLLAEKQQSPYSYTTLILFPTERAWLHQRIAGRFDKMLEQGFVQEVESLLIKWSLPPTCPAMRCVGYRQAYNYLLGKDTLTDLREKGIAATRQLAKRQLTWLRQWPDGHVFACDEPESMSKVMALVSKILDNRQF